MTFFVSLTYPFNDLEGAKRTSREIHAIINSSWTIFSDVTDTTTDGLIIWASGIPTPASRHFLALPILQQCRRLFAIPTSQ